MADRNAVINKGKILLVEEKEALMKKLGKKQLRLDLKEPLTSVPENFAKYDLTVEKDGMQLVYDYDATHDSQSALCLIGQLHDSGVHVSDLQTHQSSVEEIFVELVRDDSAEAVA